MIKSGEYIQLLEFFHKEKNFINDYCLIEQIYIIEAAKRLDELRCLHKKFRSECENWNVYPHADLMKIDLLKQDIKRICEEFKIEVAFTKKESIDFKRSFHAYYNYRKTNITSLIIFNQTRAESNISH